MDVKSLSERVEKTMSFIEKIEGLGLTEQVEEYFGKQSKEYASFGFLRKATGNMPPLEVVVNDYGRYGYHVIVNSVPYNQLYHRNTGSPIKEEEVVNQIEQYLNEVTKVKH